MDKAAFQGIHRPRLGDNTLLKARKMCLSTVQAGLCRFLCGAWGFW